MRKLLMANYSRLWRDKVFQIMMALMLLAGAVLPVIHYMDNKNNDNSWTLDSSLFSYGLLAPILLSVFTAFFIGTEYSDGTMRNKLIVGHHRRYIYLANLIVSITVGLLFDLAFILSHTCIGIPLLGGYKTEPDSILLYAGLNMALMVVFAAIYTLIAMLCRNKAYTVAGCILLVFALLFLGVRIISALNEPEYYDGYSYTENGVTIEEEEMENPNYLSGTKRKVYEFLQDFTPGSQAIKVSNMNADRPLRLVLYDCIILVAATGGGIVIFGRKDLK